MICTNEFENISEILVPRVNVDVPMNESGISSTTIGTHAVGPCIFFLLDFVIDDKPHSYLNHYSFPIDESNLSIEKVLIRILNIIWDSLKEKIENEIDSPEVLQKTSVSNFKLIVGGGDLVEGKLIREAFNLLNNDETNAISRLCHDQHVLSFYQQLIKNTFILKPVTRMMNGKAETKGTFLEVENAF